MYILAPADPTHGQRRCASREMYESKPGFGDRCPALRVAHHKLGKLPNGIPRHPNNTFTGDGWADWNDWLGIAAVQIRSFRKARAFVRGLGLKSGTEWSNYCNSGKKPADIRAKPGRAYARDGWAGMNDWLGTGKVTPGHHRSFKMARDYARRLGFKSRTEWSDFCKLGKKPADIPANPNSVYVFNGWVGWGDWIGTGWTAPIEWSGWDVSLGLVLAPARARLA